VTALCACEGARKGKGPTNREGGRHREKKSLESMPPAKLAKCAGDNGKGPRRLNSVMLGPKYKRFPEGTVHRVKGERVRGKPDFLAGVRGNRLMGRSPPYPKGEQAKTDKYTTNKHKKKKKKKNI